MNIRDEKYGDVCVCESIYMWCVYVVSIEKKRKKKKL